MCKPLRTFVFKPAQYFFKFLRFLFFCKVGQNHSIKMWSFGMSRNALLSVTIQLTSARGVIGVLNGVCGATREARESRGKMFAVQKRATKDSMVFGRPKADINICFCHLPSGVTRACINFSRSHRSLVKRKQRHFKK